MFKGFFNKTEQSPRQQEYIDSKVRKFPKVVFYIFLIYFILFAIYMGWYIYFVDTYQLSEVEGVSMQDTLNPGVSDQSEGHDLVYINKKIKPKHGDIIVINDMNENQPVKLIKRTIGLGGDYITIMRDDKCEEHRTIFNGPCYHVFRGYPDAPEGERVVRLEEDYIKSYQDWNNKSAYRDNESGIEYERDFYDQFLRNEYTIIDGVKFMQVPNFEIFYLGDNRHNSSDSRARGTGKVSKLDGVAEIILPGAAKEGASVFSIKFKQIFNFYWDKLTQFFAR